jgi:hypothetical protein
MRKLIVTTVVALGLACFFVVYCAAHGQAERKSRLIGARSVLRRAYDDYLREGVLPSRNGTWEILPYTNQVVVAGRKIQLALATTPWRDWSGEFFAMSSTKEILWLSCTNGRAVVVSEPSYAVPLWKNGY